MRECDNYYRIEATRYYLFYSTLVSSTIKFTKCSSVLLALALSLVLLLEVVIEAELNDVVLKYRRKSKECQVV